MLTGLFQIWDSIGQSPHQNYRHLPQRGMTSYHIITQLRNPEHLSFPPPLPPYLCSLFVTTPEIFRLAPFAIWGPLPVLLPVSVTMEPQSYHSCISSYGISSKRSSMTSDIKDGDHFLCVPQNLVLFTSRLYLSIILVFSSLQTPVGQERPRLVHGCLPAIWQMSGSQCYPVCLLSMHEWWFLCP